MLVKVYLVLGEGHSTAAPDRIDPLAQFTRELDRAGNERTMRRVSAHAFPSAAPDPCYCCRPLAPGSEDDAEIRPPQR